MNRFMYLEPTEHSAHIVLISLESMSWYVKNMDDITQWLEENARGHYTMDGAVLTFHDDRDIMWFLSRWG